MTIKTAGAKPISKAERLRINLTKANAKAAKALPKMDEAALVDALVRKTGEADGAARTFAHYMNNAFASEMSAFKCHWSAFTSANCRTDNEKAILARIEKLKTTVREAAITRGLAGINKPWSDMRKIAIDLYLGGAPRERNPKPLDVVQRDMLTKLYKACMKEERATPEELDVNDAIGRILIAAYKMDLSKLG